MDNQILDKIDHYLQLTIKLRWLVIIPLIFTLSAGMYMSITVPRVYEARTLILVEPQRVPTQYVQSIVDSDINSRVDTIKQQVLSRTSLENIIRQFDLFSEPEHENMFMEDKLESLRRRIAIEVTRARRGANAFEITFKGRHPEQVKNVVNSLANSFIDINLKVREEKAIGARNFLISQLEDMRKRLIETEDAIRTYRLEHMGELPEQLTANLKMLDRLQVKSTERFESLREAKERLRAFEQNAEERMQVLDGQMAQFNSQQSFLDDLMIDENDIERGVESEIRKLESEYKYLLTKYTPNHPDVIRLGKQIAEIEIKQKDEIEEQQAEQDVKDFDGQITEISELTSEDSAGILISEMERAKEKLVKEIETQRQALLLEVKEIDQEIAQIKKDMAEYQRRVDATPKREQDLISLKRDYRNIDKSYSSLLDLKLQADRAVSIEINSKGEQFRIVDPAKLPQKPISPDVKKFLVLAVAAGLAIGGGLIFLIDFLNSSIRKPDELEDAMGIPVLTSIPRIYRRRDHVIKWANICASGVFLMITFGLLSGFSLMALKGVDQTLALVKRFL